MSHERLSHPGYGVLLVLALGGSAGLAGDSPEPPSDPRVEALEARIETGRNAEKASDWSLALDEYLGALALSEKLPPQDPLRVEALESVGNLYAHRLRKPLAARPYWEEAWAIRLATDTGGGPEAWRSWSGLTSFYRWARAWDDLETIQRQIVQIQEAARPLEPRELASTLRQLARTIERLRPDDPEVTRLLERALRITTDEDDQSERSALARHYASRGRAEEAIDIFREAIRGYEAEPLLDTRALSSLYEDLAGAAESAGDPGLREHAWREAIRLRGRDAGIHHPWLSRQRQRLAEVLATQERWDEARSELQVALESAHRAWGPGSAETERLWLALAELERRAAGESLGTDPLATCDCACSQRSDPFEELLLAGRLGDALALADELVLAAESEAGPGSREVAEALGNRHRLLQNLDTAAALQDAERRFEILRSIGDAGADELSSAARETRYLASTLGRHDLSLRYSQWEVESLQAAGQLTLDLAAALDRLGQAQLRREETAAAVETLALAVEAYRHTVGPGTDDYREARRDLANALIRDGRYGRAEEILDDLVAELEPHAATDRWASTELDYALVSAVKVLRATGREDEASRVSERRQSLRHYRR